MLKQPGKFGNEGLVSVHDTVGGFDGFVLLIHRQELCSKRSLPASVDEINSMAEQFINIFFPIYLSIPNLCSLGSVIAVERSGSIPRSPEQCLHSIIWESAHCNASFHCVHPANQRWYILGFERDTQGFRSLGVHTEYMMD